MNDYEDEEGAWGERACLGCGKLVAVSDWNDKPVCGVRCLTKVDALLDASADAEIDWDAVLFPQLGDGS